MVVIKLESNYRKDLKAEYDRGYQDGLDNHDLKPNEALSTLKMLARVGANRKEVNPEQLNKLFNLVDHNYTLREKESE